MHIPTPLLRDLSSLNISTTSVRSVSHLGAWEIGVPNHQPDQRLSWSIVLALLMSKTNQTLDGFKKSLQLLFENQETSIKRIKGFIERFNPFLDRHACFYDKNLRSLVAGFLSRIENYISTNNFKHTSDISRRKLFEKNMETVLEAASLMLQCKIYVIREDQNEDLSPVLHDAVLENYPKTNTTGISNWKSEITLYCTNKRSESYSKFTFGVLKDIGKELQQKAFVKILREIIPRKEIHEMLKLNGVASNFVICLLNDKSYLNMVSFLYKQSPRTLRKLSEAGFVTDPTQPKSHYETERNAFYYVLHTDDIQLFFQLYKYAANITQEIDSSARNSCAAVIENLMRLGEILSQTRDVCKATSSSICKTPRFLHIEEFIELHDFQLEVYHQLDIIRQRINYNSNISSAIFETEKRKGMLFSILNSYSTRFSADRFVDGDKKNNITFKRYIKYIDYFQNLDAMFALFFFDYAFSLKEKLCLDSGVNENIECSLARMVFICRQYFNINGSSNIVETSPMKRTGDSYVTKFNKKEFQDFLSMMAYHSRCSLYSDLILFQNYIDNIIVSEDNVRNEFLKSEIYCLNKESIIKDDIFLFRLKHYIDIALSASINDDDDMKGVFLIERAFQILGECVKPAINDPLTPAKALVSSSLPEGISKPLRKIRDLLCRHEVKRTPSRIEIEKDKTFFKELQKKLDFIKYSLKYIFELQGLRNQMYVCQNRSDTIKNCGLSHNKKNGDASCPGELNDCAKILGTVETPVQSKTKKVKQYKKNLEQVKAIKQDIKKRTMDNAFIYENYFQNHFCWIEKHLGEKMKPNEMKKKIEHRLHCIHLLLKFLVEEVADGNVKDKFLNRIKNANFSFDNIDNKTGGANLIATAIDKIQDVSVWTISHLEVYKKLKTEIFRAMCFPKSSGNYLSNANYQNISHNCVIERFRCRLSGVRFLTDVEKKQIISEVPKNYKAHHDALKTIQSSLREGPVLSIKELDKQLHKTVIPQKKHKLLCQKYVSSDIEAFKNITDHYGKLLKSLNEDAIDKRFCEIVCRKFNFSKEVAEVLSDIVKGKDRVMIKNITLEFFYERVLKLKKIVVEDHPDVLHLWKNGKSLQIKRLMQDQIVRLYLQEPELQAAVELLFRDCIIIFKKHSIANLEHLWIKANRLFNGINLKSVLSHENPLFENVVKFLDPADLPNEIIEKVIELVNDAEAVGAIVQLQQEQNCDFASFIALMNSKNKELTVLQNTIKKCDRWTDYIRLIPPMNKIF